MDRVRMIAEIDQEIARLTSARSILGGGVTTKGKRGRPKGSGVNAAIVTDMAGAGKTKPGRPKGSLTPEGKARLSESMKRRWAEKKAAEQAKVEAKAAAKAAKKAAKEQG